MSRKLVDRDEELLKFIKQHYQLMLQSIFLGEVFKQKKKDYFSIQLKNKFQVPKNSELAKVAIEHLFKTGRIKNKPDLDKILQTDFFSKNLFNKEYYSEMVETGTAKDSDPELLSLVKEDNQKRKSEDQISEEPKKANEAVKETISKTEDKELHKVSDETISAPEQEVVPKAVEITHADSSKYDPWWIKMGLESDPFPTYDGLGSINHTLYDAIIIKTPIYEKYVTYINNIPSELFKNTVFYGQFGNRG